MDCGSLRSTTLARMDKRDNSVLTLYFRSNILTGQPRVFAKMLCTCLENPFFLLELNFFCNQSTTLNSPLSFISKQFVQEVNHTHFIYRHGDSCGILRLQLHGKSKKIMIKSCIHNT